jgi:pimeloyl-ACP methyl ester carboxylesterase
LWQRRQPFYPKGRPDLLARFVLDALKVGSRAEAGHRAVGRYRMEERAPRVRAPTLVLVGSEDPFSGPRAGTLAGAISGSEIRVLEGGMVPMPDQMPQAFARAVLDFLDAHLVGKAGGRNG